MASVKIYSITDRKLVKFNVTADDNREIVATYKDEFYKFPGGLSKAEFDKLVEATSKANRETVPLSDEEVEAQQEVIEANDELLAALSEDEN